MTDSKYAALGGTFTVDAGATPEPDTLFVSMTRGKGADEFRKRHGSVKCVVIDVDGEKHEFSADALIRLLEGLEGANDDR